MPDLLNRPVVNAATSQAEVAFDGIERIAHLIPGGDRLTGSPKYADDEWNLAGHPCWRDKNGGQTSIKFTAIPERYRTAAKDLALFQLNPGLANRRSKHPMADNWAEIQEPISPVTAQGNIKGLAQTIRVCDNNGITAFDDDDWNRLPILLIQPIDRDEKRQGATLSSTTGRMRAFLLTALWQVCQMTHRTNLLGEDTPFGGTNVKALFGRRNGRNSIRPHENVGAILGFTAWFFDNVAENIVDHIEWWTEHTPDEAPLSLRSLKEEMLELVEQIAYEHDGQVPGSVNQNGDITLSPAPLARLLGVHNADDAYAAGRFAMAHLKNTVTPTENMTPCPEPITRLPHRDGGTVPWQDRLLPSMHELDVWQRRLIYCAMFYISATTMLRDSQLALLPLDCLTTQTLERPDGTSYVQHTLSAYLTKNRHADVRTTVVVNGRVAGIIALLQRLQRAIGYEPFISPSTGVACLFDARLATPHGKAMRVDSRDQIHLDQAFVKVIQNGARLLYDQGVIHDHLDDTKVTMQQVRITCAQAYAIREHGQALVAAYGKWTSSAVMKGYVGDVHRLISPIDPSEVKDILHKDRGNRLVRLAADTTSHTGNGLPRLAETLESAGLTAVANPQPLTPARLAALGKNHPNIEQGPLTLCLYQSEGALCGGRGKPDFRLCQPGACRNSVMSRADRARHELMRRQHLSLNAPVLQRAASRMDDLNPEIATEFATTSNEQLQTIITEHMADYLKDAINNYETVTR